MYYLLAILSGVVISIMVSLNGGLTASYGTYWAAVIIHVVGVIFAVVVCLIRKEKVRIKSKAPAWAYLGGVIGVSTTLFNLYAFGRISVTSIVALGLLGQSLTSVFLDSFGLLGSTKRPLKKTFMIGFLPAIIGIFIMLDSSVSESILAVILSLCAGVSIVLSRTVNAKLATETSPLVGSFLNHLIGLGVCIILVLCFQRPILEMVHAPKPWIFLGGVLGVITVLLFNVIVPRMTAFRLTLLSFIGQIFTSVVLDFILGLENSNATFVGGLVISIGLLANMGFEQLSNRKEQIKSELPKEI